MNKITGIYCFENLINGKCYIGESKDVKHRYNQHICSCNNKKSKAYYFEIYSDMRKYGIKNFNFCILEECKPDDLLTREGYYIEKFNSVENGYNSKLCQIGTITIYSKYDVAFIQNIIHSLINDNLSISDIALKFNMPRTTVSMMNNGNIYKTDDLSYPLRKLKSRNKKISLCCDCGKQIGYKSMRCRACDTKFRRNKPLVVIDKETLLQLLQSGESQSNIAKTHNVSNSSVKKWRVKYDCYQKKETLKPDSSVLTKLVIELGAQKAANMYSVNESTIFDWLNSYGLQLLSDNRVLCVETNIIYESKRDAARQMFPLLKSKDAAYKISIASKTNTEYKGYHWSMLNREIIQI